MSPAAAYEVVRIPGLKMTEHRGVVLLSSSQDTSVDAVQAFDALDAKRERIVRTRLEHWIDNIATTNKKWSHGFTHPDYRECYVFKWAHRRRNHRLYGFLCHPTLATSRRFQVCVLVSHAIKPGWETDLSELDGANALRANSAVQAALRLEFMGRGPKGKKWQH